MGVRIGLGVVVAFGVASCGARPRPAVVAPAASTASAEPALQLSLPRSPETVGSLRRTAGCDDLLARGDRAQDRWADPVRDPQRAVCSTWRHVLTMQADARKDRDLIRLRCGVDKLAELEQVLDEALALGAASGAPGLVSDARRRIVTLDQLAARSYAIDAEAAACVGEEAGAARS